MSELKELPPEKLHFIVPDVAESGKKVHKREENLKNIPCVKLDEKAIFQIITAENNQNLISFALHESMEKVIETLEGNAEMENFEKNLRVLTTTNLKNRRHFSGKILELNSHEIFSTTSFYRLVCPRHSFCK